MKILVFSDTHGDIDQAEEVVREHNDIDLIIHLGDYYRDAQKLSDIFPGIPVEYIYGNSDFLIENVSSEKLLECAGKKIFITHGHRYSVKWDYEKIYRKAEEMNADLILFGHTHISALIGKGRYFAVNPGSISDPRDGAYQSYAMIEIRGNEIIPELYHIGMSRRMTV